VVLGVTRFKMPSRLSFANHCKGANWHGGIFKELVVWQRAVQLCKEVYGLTSSFPSSEQFGLTSQLRRASVSIASNIAEGYGRSTRGEYLLFLGHARGSNCELQTQLLISQELGFGSKKAQEPAAKLSEDVSRMLIALMKKLKE
jgi:four helix bundle protein